ncbi:PAS domain S-box protein [bacterium]|nr:PAS domain S-box protein [bacterium]
MPKKIKKTARILAIDDEADFLELIKDFLAAFKPEFEVLTTTSCKKGLDLARLEQPDIILLDIKMPIMDGYQVCQQLKAETITSHIPVIFLTGIDLGPAERIQGLEAGGDAFLTKPFNESELIAKIEAMLRLKQAEDTLRKKLSELEDSVKERTEELEASRTKYKDLYDHAPDMFVTVESSKKVIIECNEAFTRAIDFTQEELKGRSFLDCYHSESLDEAERTLDRLNKSGEVHDVELYLLSKSGAKIDVRLSASTQCDAQGKALFNRCVMRDIRPRKQLERKLRKTQAQQKKLIANIPGMIYHGNADWSAEIISGSEQICGYKVEELMALESNWLEIIHPEDRAKIESEGAPLTKEPTDLIQIYRILHKSGAVRWVEDRKASHFSSDGSFAGIDGVVYDITHRRIAEDALLVSEEKYRTIVENVDEGLFEVDLKGHFTYVNRALCEMIGYDREELIGMDNRDIASPESAKIMLNTFNEIYRTGKPVHLFDFDIINKNGQAGLAEVSASLIIGSDNEPVGFRGIVRDVTARREMEYALEESEARFRSAFDNATIGRAIANMSGQFLMINSAFCDMLGYQEKQLLELDWMQITYPDDLEKSSNYGRELATGQRDHFRYIHRLLHRSGEPIWVDLNVIQLRDTEGNPQYVVGDVVDITEQKLAETEIESTNKLIEQERNMFMGGPVVVFKWSLNAEKPVNYVSPNVKNLLGYSVDEFLSGAISYRQIIHDEDWERVSMEVREHSQTHVDTFEHIPYRLKRKDGEFVWVFDYTTILRDKGGEVEQYFGYIFDITSSIQAKEILLETNKELTMLAQTVESMHESVSITDLNHQFIFVNRAFEQSYGYQKKELLGKTTDLIMAPKQENKHKKSRQATIDGGWKGELKNIRKNGEVFSVELSTTPLKNENGDTIAYIGISADITERQRAEEALRNSEGKYRLLFENMMNGFALHEIVLDKSGKPVDYKFLEVNHAFEKLTTLKRKDIIGKTATMVIPGIESDPANWISVYGKVALSGEETRLEQYAKPLNKWYSVLAFSPRKNQFATVFEDVTERVEAEQKLSVYADKVKAINVASRTLASSLSLEIVGQRCAEIAGELFSADDVTIFILDKKKRLKPIFTTGKYFDEIMMLRMELGEGFTGKVAQSGISEISNRIDLTDLGKQVPGTPDEPESLMGAPLKIQNEVIGVMTLSKLGKEEFLAEDLTFLENLADISAVSMQNAQLYEDAISAENVKSLFLANMSHEIRTPLNSILGFTDLMEQTFRDRIGAVEQEYFDIIRTSSNRLMHTVHEILDISQIQAGAVDINRRAMDLGELMEKLLAQFKNQATEKALKLEYEQNLPSSTVYIDESSISTAVSSLLDNALKYTKAGWVKVVLDQEGKKYQLHISDSGIGMAPQYLENLYDAFSQESMGYTKKFQGVGLGLAICKRCLDLNEVEISVSSEQGKGTTFVLEFEVFESSQPVESELIISGRKAGTKVSTDQHDSRYQILHVEDDPNSQKLVGLYLKATCDLFFAESVSEALDILNEQNVDLILLDLSLRGDEDGLDLAIKLRKTKKWRDLPIVAVTAHAFIADREKVMKNGCTDYLSKPISRIDLLDKIEQHVDN